MDDILKRLRDQSRSDKDGSPLSNIFGKPGEEEEEEKKEEEDMKITHYGKESGGDRGTGVFQGVDLDSAASAPSGIGGEGVRELNTSDLDKPARAPELGSESVSEVDLDRPVSRPRRSASGKTITLKTADQNKTKYLSLVVALAEAEYFDQAIEALNELRGLARR
jgi:hypothetical protein